MSAGDGFGLDHLPLGVVEKSAGSRFAAVRVGDRAIDLRQLRTHGELFAQPSLDRLLAAGPDVWQAVRRETELLAADPAPDAVHPLSEVRTLLPFTVGDYVDFYASEHHATNVGRLFRPDTEPLTPNWKHLPIGYHGRAGTVVVSGTPVRRPAGQHRSPSGAVLFGPSSRLDLEAEVAFVIGASSPLGTPIELAEFRDHVFGVCLLNDWSARDIQAWEYVPLGPFLGKSFATSISGWITPLAALDAAWTSPAARDRPLLGYLDDAGIDGGLDLMLEIRLNGTVIARPPFKAMYWTPAQMLAHMTVNGASTRAGDVFASGTVSGARPAELGCLLELTANGAPPLGLPDSTQRTFLLDGDEVVITATAPSATGGLLRLAEVRGRIIAGSSRAD